MIRVGCRFSDGVPKLVCCHEAEASIFLISPHGFHAVACGKFQAEMIRRGDSSELI